MAKPHGIEEARRVAQAAGIIGLPKSGSSKNDLSLSSLWSDLRNAATWFAVGKKLRKAPLLNKKLAKVAKQANRLAATLSDEEVFCFLQDHFPPRNAIGGY